MTPFLVALMILTWVTFAVGWLGGGHTERFAVTVVFCDYVLTRATAGMSGGHELVAVSETVVAAIFIWLALRSSRWWTLVASAALMLCVVVFVLEWMHPGVSRDTAISARIGLWMVVSLSLLAGVRERWLAGEAAVSPLTVWRRRPVAGRSRG